MTSFTTICLSLVLLLSRGNISSSPFSQGRYVYSKTPIAAIYYIKRAGFTSRTTAQKMKFFIKDFFSVDVTKSAGNRQETADLVTFIEEILNGKFEGYCIYLMKSISVPTFLR